MLYFLLPKEYDPLLLYIESHRAHVFEICIVQFSLTLFSWCFFFMFKFQIRPRYFDPKVPVTFDPGGVCGVGNINKNDIKI